MLQTLFVAPVMISFSSVDNRAANNWRIISSLSLCANSTSSSITSSTGSIIISSLIGAGVSIFCDVSISSNTFSIPWSSVIAANSAFSAITGGIIVFSKPISIKNSYHSAMVTTPSWLASNISKIELTTHGGGGAPVIFTISSMISA